MIMKKMFFLMLIMVVFASCSSRRCPECDCAEIEHAEYIPEEPTEVERLVYIALGDSVSEGFGIWSQADRHTSVFFEMLYAEGLANEYVNAAVSGYTTADLLLLLNESSLLDAMQYASVITLNIGGNNILAPLWEHLPDADEIQEIVSETITFARDVLELFTEIMEFTHESRDSIEDVLELANEVVDFAENFSILDIFRLNEMLSAAPPIIDGAMSVFAEVNELEATATNMFAKTSELGILRIFSLISGNLPDELIEEFDEGIRVFSYEFAEILSWLEQNAPNATIIVNTVYNPLPTNFLGMPFGLSNESQKLVQAINYVIYNESSPRGFVVSDVYAVLSNRTDMMNSSFDIIHPNPRGHYEIARINFADTISILK
ncbi:MAG: SGNH/GDSL hydrolase family protein [Defluviitaleaceae bacterium]|nr:SGNH/GDSL hydrolase family protein [Defluviitaleaceae bacterium]